ncbi:MAG: hypothetical protein HFG26_03300 [Provencibacterium sp.]|jgi:hypothetical protein|nr:hypothetical protein [Provencibacterium sp.]
MTNLEYLRQSVRLPVKDRRLKGSPFQELVKLELMARGESAPALNTECLDATLQWVDARNDCADFYIPALQLMLRRHRSLLPEGYAQKIEESLAGFKYWLDEPGEVHACFFTENHQILFHSAEYLVGQLLPDRVFSSNGETGAWHKEHALAYIRRWIDWRTRFGFSEWLTDGYYCEDIEALLGLAYCADEEDIRLRCLMLVDMLMFDVAVNAQDGFLCGTHGRIYAPSLVSPKGQGVSPVCALYWGEGCGDQFSDAAALLALYDYRLPEAIRKAALDKPAVMINRERMSIDVADAKYYGVDPADFDNIMLFWGIQAYSDRLVIENSLKVYPYWNWMVNRVRAYKERYDRSDEAGLPCPEGTPDYTAMTEVNIYTYKTPDYLLSCAQDFRKGRMGYQQHPWAAHLGGGVQVFTTSPASDDYTARPNQLAGNLNLPRAAAHENVLLCIYRIEPDFVDYLYSHAYFPRDQFDETMERDGWVFGRKGDAYIALRSLLPARWKPAGEAFSSVFPDIEVRQPFDYMAPGHANVWVTELGSKAQNGSFQDFCSRFSAEALTGDTLSFQYQSPSQGEMRFGWVKPLTVAGEPVPLHGYPRYDNPYCTAEFNTERLEIRCGGSTAILDHQGLERIDR